MESWEKRNDFKNWMGYVHWDCAKLHNSVRLQLSCKKKEIQNSGRCKRLVIVTFEMHITRNLCVYDWIIKPVQDSLGI